MHWNICDFTRKLKPHTRVIYVPQSLHIRLLECARARASVCVCVYVRACVCVYVCVCVRARARLSVYVYVCVLRKSVSDVKINAFSSCCSFGL